MNSPKRSFAVCALAFACGCGQGADEKPLAAASGSSAGSAAPVTSASSAAPTDVVGRDALLGACVDDQQGKPYVCDEFYGDASATVDRLKGGCNAISQHWVASCPTPERIGACKLGMKPYAGYELQWSYKGKPPNDSVEAVKKVCEKTQRGTFVEAK